MSEKKGFFARLKGVKNIEIIIAAVAVGVMLIIYFSGFVGKKQQDVAPKSYGDYCERMSAEVEELVSGIGGAGKTKVVINWESSVELILAENESFGANSSTSAPQIITSGGASSPIILKEIYPKALGVAVVCEGGGNAKVKVDIIMAVSTLLKIEPEKIIVLPSGKKK